MPEVTLKNPDPYTQYVLVIPWVSFLIPMFKIYVKNVLTGWEDASAGKGLAMQA